MPQFLRGWDFNSNITQPGAYAVNHVPPSVRSIPGWMRDDAYCELVRGIAFALAFLYEMPGLDIQRTKDPMKSRNPRIATDKSI